TTFGLKRAGNAASMPPSVIEAVFAAAKGGAGSARGKDATERVVFVLTDITVPGFDAASSEGKRIEETTRRSLSEDLLAQYVGRLQTELGASINMEALRRVASGSSDQNCMQIEPSAGPFAALYQRGEPQVVWTTLVADLETPVSAFLK